MENQMENTLSEILKEIRMMADKHPTSFIFLIFSFILVALSISLNRYVPLTFWTLFYALLNHFGTIFRKSAADSNLIKKLFDNWFFVLLYYIIMYAILFIWAFGVLTLTDSWSVFEWPF